MHDFPHFFSRQPFQSEMGRLGMISGRGSDLPAASEAGAQRDHQVLPDATNPRQLRLLDLNRLQKSETVHIFISLLG